MIIKSYDEYEIMVERLRRIDKKDYDSENEHRFILESIKTCFRETIHQRDYIKQLEKKMKEIEILEILKKYVKYYKLLEDVEAISIELQNKVHKEDFNKIKEWLDNDK